MKNKVLQSMLEKQNPDCEIRTVTRSLKGSPEQEIEGFSFKDTSYSVLLLNLSKIQEKKKVCQVQ